MNDQFVLAHGTEEFVVIVTVNPDRGHVWSAKDRAQADRWVDFWDGRADDITVIPMIDYIASEC